MGVKAQTIEVIALQAAVKQAAHELEYAEDHIVGYQILRNHLLTVADRLRDLVGEDEPGQQTAYRFFLAKSTEANHEQA